MLYFTRWKALGIILTALVVCLCAVPNFFPEAQVRTWPAWAQRRLVLGLDLQGGSHLLLQVDANAVQKAMIETLADDARRLLRDAHIRYSELATQHDGIELRTTDADLQRALGKLSELSQPLPGLLARTGQRSTAITQLGEGRIRIAPTQLAINERVRQALQQSLQIVERRVNDLGTVEPTVESEGTDRILVEVPGLKDPGRLEALLGKTAKMTFQLVDESMSAEQA